MALRNTATEFGALAKSLHWLVAMGLFVLIYLGLEQSGMESGPAKDEIRFIHGSIALVVFFLMTLRIVWRWTNEVPAHPDGIAPWQRVSATAVHWGLYIAVFTQLTAGAMIVATAGKGLPFFGLFSIRLPVAENHDQHEWWEEVHEIVWIPIAVLITVHILAALHNHFIAKNDVLRRMTLGVK